MNKISTLKLFAIFLLSINTFSYPNGNPNDFEMASAVYRDLAGFTIDYLGTAQHWHTAQFNYFEYLNTGVGKMEYSEMDFLAFAGDASNNKEVTKTINLDLLNLDALKVDFIQTFRDADGEIMPYNGSYTVNNITANTRADIASTGIVVGGDSDLGYTWQDMLDVNNVWCWDHYFWCEHWNGQVYRMDELRCDGLVEYSYEKNDVIVSKIFYTDGSINTQRQNIATPDQENVNYHNILHEGVHCCNELCPRIQAGENHRGSGTERSNFDPLIALDPTISNFSRTQFSDKIQLNFKVADNASVKAYVLIQIKKTSESTWRILIDKNNNTWKFKEVDLTDWNGSIQSDYFHIPWAGKHDGGYYSSHDHNFNIKATVIDQGANHDNFNYTFTGNLPSLGVNLTGPSSLNENQSGQFTSNPSGGTPQYSYSWKFFPVCPDGGGIEKAGKGKKNSIQADMCGSWINFGGNNQTVPHSDPYCFYVKSTVSDAAGNAVIATHYVSVASNSNSKDEEEVVIENSSPKETKLFENFPNPFNPTTTIKYQLKNDGFVAIKIYDVLGKVVANLVNENKSSGLYSVSFNANSLPSGVYIYSIRTADFVANKKMLLMK